MTAYVLSEVEILDPESVGRYKEAAPATIAAYGGTYLARDAVPEAFEGGFDAGERIVLIRFPDGVGRIQGSYAEAPPPPLEGSPEQMADRMRAYAREGVSHIQLVIDPITRGSVEVFAPVLRLLDG